MRYGGPLVSLFPFLSRTVGCAALASLVSLAVHNVATCDTSTGVARLIALGSCAGCALLIVAAGNITRVLMA